MGLRAAAVVVVVGVVAVGQWRRLVRTSAHAPAAASETNSRSRSTRVGPETL